MENDLKGMVSDNEKILYEGKPNKKCFIFESIFNPMLPFALVWALFDFFVIGVSMAFGQDSKMGFFIIPFMLFHLMPVWIYLAGAIFTIRRYKNTYYIVTDSAIYVSSGVFRKNYNTKSFAEMSQVNLHRGIFDQMFNVGDVIITSNQMMMEGRVSSVSINSISEYMEVYNIIKKLQKDIYSDIMYPNDMRPKENHGYNTEYKG